MAICSLYHHLSKTAAAEIARPGSEWRWMGKDGRVWVGAWKVYAPQSRVRVESIGSADHSGKGHAELPGRLELVSVVDDIADV
jgi:hypothetical protein